METASTCDGRTGRRKETDGHTTIAYTALAQRRAVKILNVLPYMSLSLLTL